MLVGLTAGVMWIMSNSHNFRELHTFITPRTCARGEVIGHVVVVVHKKLPDPKILAPQRLESITNLLKLVENWPQDA